MHCASNRKGDAQATRNLVQAATQAATQSGESQPHLVYISIVGVDRFPRGYFKAKLEAERVVAESGLPWTTLRATQFYELIAKGATRLAKLPVIPVPASTSWSSRSIPARPRPGSPNLPSASRPAGYPTWPVRRSSASPT